MFKKIYGYLNSILQHGFAKAGMYYAIANVIGQGVVLLSSAVFTRMMDKDSYGLVNTYSTWVLILNTFICLNLFVTVRNAYIDYKDDYGRYTSSVLFLSLLAGGGMAAVIAAVNFAAGTGITVWEIVLACTQSIALNAINYKMAVQSMQNKYCARAVLMIVPNWIHTALSIMLMLVFTGNLYYAKIAGNAVGLMICAAVCIVTVFMKHKPVIDRIYWRYSVKIALPSIFHTLSDLILMQSDRLMLTSLAGAGATAEYSVVYNVCSVILAIYQALNGAWTPWFFGRAAHKDYKAVRKCHACYIGLFTVFSCGMMTISPELIKLLSPADYWDGIRYVGALVAASYLIFLYAFFAGYLMYKKNAGRVAGNTVTAAVVNLVLNYLLIPAQKAQGAVAATVISYLLLFFLHYGSIGKEGKRYFSVGMIWINILAITIYGVISCLLRDYCAARYLIFIAAAMVLAAVFKDRVLGLLIIKGDQKR